MRKTILIFDLLLFYKRLKNLHSFRAQHIYISMRERIYIYVFKYLKKLLYEMW